MYSVLKKLVMLKVLSKVSNWLVMYSAANLLDFLKVFSMAWKLSGTPKVFLMESWKEFLMV